LSDPPVEETLSKKQTRLDSIQAAKKATESIIKMNQEIKEYAENPSIGIDEETIMAFIADRKWKLNPIGHTKTIRDKIKALYLEIITILKTEKTQVDVISNLDKIDKIAKQILELGLDKTFNYDKEADEPDVGPIALKLLAQEVGHFLVVRGGRVASKHLQTLRTIDQLNHLLDSNIMKD